MNGLVRGRRRRSDVAVSENDEGDHRKSRNDERRQTMRSGGRRRRGMHRFGLSALPLWAGHMEEVIVIEVVRLRSRGCAVSWLLGYRVAGLAPKSDEQSPQRHREHR